VLKGEVVVLRPVEREDMTRLAALWQDLETVTRRSSFPPLPKSAADLEALYDRDTADPPTDLAFFVVEARGEAIGMAGLHRIDHFNSRAELGLGLVPERVGQGYGQDAARVLVEYAFRHLNLRRVWLEVLADDGRAVGAYRKAGFVEEGRLRGHAWFAGEWRDCLVMAVLRDGAEAAGDAGAGAGDAGAAGPGAGPVG
jgi:RimJ/RimL family protein N-acetyltransferase